MDIDFLLNNQFLLVGLGLFTALLLIGMTVGLVLVAGRRPKNKEQGKHEKETHHDDHHSSSHGGSSGFSLKNLMTGALAVILLIGIIWWSPWKDWDFSQRPYQAAYTTTSPECPGGPISFDQLGLSGEWRSIPSNCRFVYDIRSGQIELSDGKRIANAEGWIDFVPTKARATTGRVEGYYAFCPMRTVTRPIHWDCTPQ